LTPLVAFVLGIVEGLTEYLPVSSTGHLRLAGAAIARLTGGTSEAFSFDVVIQLGAVLAVVVQYRVLLARRLAGLLARDAASLRLVGALACGFAPTAACGLLFRKAIKHYLDGAAPIAGALLVGGVVMIAVERARKARHAEGLVGLEHVTWRRGLAIGFAQCVSLWPGSSRSMCTIVAGQLTGLSTATAAEFSFLLALPTLGAATLYEGWKGRADLASAGAANVAIGFVVAFVVAWIVIAGFIKYLQKHGLEAFGWYRIALGLVVMALLLRAG
jgi:undecaprenyl-diphosphatase